MKKIALFGALALVLTACTAPAPPPPTPRAIAVDFLTKNGFRVVDLSEIGNVTTSSGGSTEVNPPATVCQSAPWGGAYRAFLADGRTAIGVVCVEQDNSVTVPLQKIVG